jgi:hypothetical protein
MTGNTGYCFGLIGRIFIEAHILLVDVIGHDHHLTRNFFFGLIVTGEVQVTWVRSALGMAISAFDAQRRLEVVHDHVQAVPADVLRKHLKVVLVLGRLLAVPGGKSGNDGSHGNYRSYRQQAFLLDDKGHKMNMINN